MSFGMVIGYVCVSLCYVSLQVNKNRSIFPIWVGDECEMFGFVMWILMGSVRGWFLDDRIAGNAWFLWVKLGWSGCFVLNNLYGFFEDFDWVRLKPYFIRVWGDFGRLFRWFLTMLKRRRTLIFQGFVELGIELKVGVEAWKHQICPFRQSNICSKM